MAFFHQNLEPKQWAKMSANMLTAVQFSSNRLSKSSHIGIVQLVINVTRFQTVLLHTRFTLLKDHLIEFNQLAMANAEGSDNMLNRVMPKDNIGLAALLKIKESAWEGLTPEQAHIVQPILVCTAHIHWDPEFCDVKLIQTMMLCNELKTILEDLNHNARPPHKYDASNVQLLLCGDFNSLPDSGVIEFLSSGRVSNDHQDFKELGYKSCLQRLLGADSMNEFTHPFRLASAYSEVTSIEMLSFGQRGLFIYTICLLFVTGHYAIHQLHIRFQGHHRLHFLFEKWHGTAWAARSIIK